MYAVIFRAEISEFDPEYPEMAERMRNLAINEYGCKKIVVVTEGNTEIAISYWDNEKQIKEWKQNSEHLTAQSKGRSKWYKSYTVEIVDIVRSYASGT